MVLSGKVIVLLALTIRLKLFVVRVLVVFELVNVGEPRSVSCISDLTLSVVRARQPCSCTGALTLFPVSVDWRCILLYTVGVSK